MQQGVSKAKTAKYIRYQIRTWNLKHGTGILLAYDVDIFTFVNFESSNKSSNETSITTSTSSFLYITGFDSKNPKICHTKYTNTLKNKNKALIEKKNNFNI